MKKIDGRTKAGRAAKARRAKNDRGAQELKDLLSGAMYKHEAIPGIAALYETSDTLPFLSQSGRRYEARADADPVYPDSPAAAQQVGGNHYKDLAVQPWAAMESWMSTEAFAGFLRGNAIKYLARCDKKGGIEDVKKAQHYLTKLLEVLS